MDVFVDVYRWLTDAAHWSGEGGIPVRTLQHLELSFAAVGLSVAVALPMGILIGHVRRGEFIAVSTANIGRAIPSFAILSLSFIIIIQFHPKIAFGFVPTLIALVLLGIPPILTNAIVAVQGVDADTVEAAKGMGLSGKQVLTRLELPLAAPVIMAGIRVSTLQIVATATLSAVIGGGTLGRPIVDGLATFDVAESVAGAVLVATLALVVDGAFALLERAVSPRLTSTTRAVTPGPVGDIEPLKTA